MFRTATLLALCLSFSALAQKSDDKRKAHFGPPREATRACLDAQPGAACSYTLKAEKVVGTCTQAAPTELLSCQAPRSPAPTPPAAK
jgi:hypothetical protein